jgi:alpha-L-fucosidase
LLKLVRLLQPDCIVNVRIGNGLGDFGTPEQEIPEASSGKAWETCMTMNRHWGYVKTDQDWKSTATLVRNLIDVVSKGGNYLLNVGPTEEGTFPPPALDRLAGIGRWMQVNGEAIYGAHPAPFGQEPGSLDRAGKVQMEKAESDPRWEWRATAKPGKLFIHVFQWPAGELKIPAVTAIIKRAFLLASPQTPLAVKQTDAGVSIRLPSQAPDAMASVICLELDPP